MGGGAGNLGSLPGWGIDNNLTRELSAADPVQIALIKGLVADSMNFVMALGVGAHLPSIPGLGFSSGVVPAFGNARG